MHQQRTARESRCADTGVFPRIAPTTTALLLLRRRRRRAVILAATTSAVVAALIVALGRTPVAALPITALSVALLRWWWAVSIPSLSVATLSVALLLLLLASVSRPGVVECALAGVLVDEEPAALSALPLGVPWG
jgi:hypothetical protein